MWSGVDPTLTALIAGLLLLIAFIIYRRKFSATGQRGNTFVLTGRMNAGKTALFYALRQGEFRATHTSMMENDATFVVKQLEGKVGHARRDPCVMCTWIQVV
jgi:hypothetical protein